MCRSSCHLIAIAAGGPAVQLAHRPGQQLASPFGRGSRCSGTQTPSFGSISSRIAPASSSPARSGGGLDVAEPKRRRLGQRTEHADLLHESRCRGDNLRIARRATVQDENGQPIFVGPPFRIVGATSLMSSLHRSRIVWYNDTTGETQMWFMNDADISAVVEAGVKHPERIALRATVRDENDQPIFIGPPFRIVGVADFDPDPLHHTQRGDIVWHHDTTHETQIWFMTDDGDKIARRATAEDENGQPIFVGPPFRVVATGTTRL
jgi:hypothetical protein